MGVTLLGARVDTIDKAEDRQMFKDTLAEINEPTIPSEVVNDIENAVRVAEEIGLPVIIRPAFTLGGSGGGIAYTQDELAFDAKAELLLTRGFTSITAYSKDEGSSAN